MAFDWFHLMHINCIVKANNRNVNIIKRLAVHSIPRSSVCLNSKFNLNCHLVKPSKQNRLVFCYKYIKQIGLVTRMNK